MFNEFTYQVEEPYDPKFQYCAYDVHKQPCLGDSGGSAIMEVSDHMYTVRQKAIIIL